MDSSGVTTRINIRVKMEKDDCGPLFVAVCDELERVTGRTLLELRANLEQALQAQRAADEQYVVLMAFA
jgi:hypothetical protein